MDTRKLTGMALLVAMGAAFGVFYIPMGAAKVFPVQHAINVIAAVLLGPGPAVLVAFCIAVLRNMLGIGTIMAFPGGMIGAFVAGMVYRMVRRDYAAAIGEVFGTGVLGALAAFPLARFILGRDVLALAFVVPFAISSLGGAILGLITIRVISLARFKLTERA
jgi:energy coupling factor transporter S component ThiW